MGHTAVGTFVAPEWASEPGGLDAEDGASACWTMTVTGVVVVVMAALVTDPADWADWADCEPHSAGHRGAPALTP